MPFKLTHNAQCVLLSAERRAKDLHQSYLGTDHLLLALLEQKDPEGFFFLND